MHTNTGKQGHLKTEQKMKTPDEETETKTKEAENLTKNFESKNNTTYTKENREWNNRKDSTGKNGLRNRVKKFKKS